MTTFITRLDPTGSGPRVAVKDIIDVAGVPTTAGSRAVEKSAAPAARDAACLAGIRAADARIVGKTNLHELAMLPIGTNPWFGTPTNPLDPALIPGGSSSGSATAVAEDEADVALGSDTGGSIRLPSACCGTAGLKTTHGRVSLDGVWPLAPSLDTIGPMAKDMTRVTQGMQLLEPGFTPAAAAATRIGRVRTGGLPDIEAAVDGALQAAGFEVVAVPWDVLAAGNDLFMAIFFSEVWDADHALVEQNPDGVGADITETMGLCEIFRPGLAEAQQKLDAWRQSVFALFDDVELLALPTMPIFPPTLADVSDPAKFVDIITELSSFVSVFNVAGTPCTAQPIPVDGSSLPASLQLVGPRNGEELLVTTARHVEDALG
jgi:amidase